LSSFFWNSGPQPPAAGGGGTSGGGTWPGWGGMYGGPHGIQGGGVAGGAVPPTLNAAGQALLAHMQGGPSFRIGDMGPLWQQLGMSAAPTPAATTAPGAMNEYGPVMVTPHGAGYSSSSSPQHSPLYNPTGGASATNAWPPGQSWPGGTPGGPPVAGATPEQLSAFQQYIMRRWPGWNPGWNQGPPGAQ
jgi:hypothetical protein